MINFDTVYIQDTSGRFFTRLVPKDPGGSADNNQTTVQPVHEEPRDLVLEQMIIRTLPSVQGTLSGFALALFLVTIFSPSDKTLSYFLEDYARVFFRVYYLLISSCLVGISAIACRKWRQKDVVRRQLCIPVLLYFVKFVAIIVSGNTVRIFAYAYGQETRNWYELENQGSKVDTDIHFWKKITFVIFASTVFSLIFPMTKMN